MSNVKIYYKIPSIVHALDMKYGALQRIHEQKGILDPVTKYRTLIFEIDSGRMEWSTLITHRLRLTLPPGWPGGGTGGRGTSGSRCPPGWSSGPPCPGSGRGRSNWSRGWAHGAHGDGGDLKYRGFSVRA